MRPYPPARLIKSKASCMVNMNGTERRLGLANLIAESKVSADMLQSNHDLADRLVVYESY